MEAVETQKGPGASNKVKQAKAQEGSMAQCEKAERDKALLRLGCDVWAEQKPDDE